MNGVTIRIISPYSLGLESSIRAIPAGMANAALFFLSPHAGHIIGEVRCLTTNIHSKISFGYQGV